jgi:hypothetical protein
VRLALVLAPFFTVAPLGAQLPDSLVRPPRVDTVLIPTDSAARRESNARRDSIARAAARDSIARAAARDSIARAGVRDSTARAVRPTRPLTAEAIWVMKKDSVLDLKWPVEGPAPLPGSILPFKRIIAFYGNPLSTRMGVLGEYHPDTMLAMLDAEVKTWEAADPETPVQPALHLIAVVASGHAGRDGKYRNRMGDSVIERVAAWAERRNAIVFLDIQTGHSTIRDELPRLANWLARPNFHLALDPEFSMKLGGLPGVRVGTMDAEDINYATEYLANLVVNHKLPPKVLVVHRYTQRMFTNYQNVTLRPEVQIVMHMDGFGTPTLKKNTFRNYIKAEPVQYVGWKQFFKAKNDTPRTTIEQILGLNPKVLYVQYQ